jgi:hypothetical protein
MEKYLSAGDLDAIGSIELSTAIIIGVHQLMHQHIFNCSLCRKIILTHCNLNTPNQKSIFAPGDKISIKLI